MTRRIVGTELQATATGGSLDTYFDRVVKYVPADVVAAWLFVGTVIRSAIDGSSVGLEWAAFGFLLIFTPFWTLKQARVKGLPPAVVQSSIAFVSFAVWVFALGEPFSGLDWYRPLYGSLALVAFTLLVALLNSPDEKP